LKPYPFNLIDDLMIVEQFYSELNDEEVAREIEKLLIGLSDIYVKNKHIPHKMQTVIRLKYAVGLTHREIGEILGISSSRVGQIKDRVLRILRHPSRFNRLVLKEDEKTE